MPNELDDDTAMMIEPLSVGVRAALRCLPEPDQRVLVVGSGMIGLPGDNTPPSRFVRAVAWTQTARSTPTSSETVYEMLRILDNFNLPLGAAEGSGSAAEDLLKGMRSSTIWTSVWDLAEETLYFHTQHSRRLRKVSLDGVDFDGEGIRHIPLDRKKLQETEDLTPGG